MILYNFSKGQLTNINFMLIFLLVDFMIYS